MTPEQATLHQILKAVLPPITDRLDAMDSFTGPVCLDLEWDGPELTLIGVGDASKVVQLSWHTTDYERGAIRRSILSLFSRVPVLVQNIIGDLKVLRKHAFLVNFSSFREFEDPMLAHAMLHSEEAHDLEYLVSRYGTLPPAYKALRTVPEAASEYNAADVVSTCEVWSKIEAELNADPGAKLAYMFAKMFLPIQLEAEEAGIAVDALKVLELRQRYESRIKEAQRIVTAWAGWPLSLASPDQVKYQLYNTERFPVQRNRDQKPTTNKDAISALRRKVGTEWDPEVEPTVESTLANIDAGGNPTLESRALFLGAQQTLTHYLDPCCVFNDKDELIGVRERVYPQCRQHVQASGRHSYVTGDDPEFPGVPAQQMKGDVALVLEPDPGTAWVGFDWSNIEVWILGYLANDPLIIQAKEERWDLHTLNCCDIMGVEYPPIRTKALHTAPEAEAWRQTNHWQGPEDLRRLFAKRFVFRLHYRGDPANAGDIPGTAALGFTPLKLVEASERYLGAHLALVAYWDRLAYDVVATGMVRTFMGRPRRLTAQHPAARMREGSNHPMQGGVADVYVTTAIEIAAAAPWARLVYGTHDAQKWQVPEERESEFLTLIKPIVERTFMIDNRPVNFPAEYTVRRRD